MFATKPSKSTKYLRIYYRFVCITSIPIAILLIFSRRDVFRSNWKFSNYYGAIVSALFFTLSMWLFWELRYHVKRLGSPLMQQLAHYIEAEKEKWKNIKNDILENPLPKPNSPSERFNDTIMEIGSSDIEFPSVPIQTLDRHIISPLDIILRRTPIADGMFGIVHKGSLVRQSCSQDVVLKAAKNTENAITFNMLLQEIKIFIHAGDHINVVKFYGVTSDARLKYNLCIVNEFCSEGNLDDFLNENKTAFEIMTRKSMPRKNSTAHTDTKKSFSFNVNHLIGFASQICAGMCHLISKNIIHGDLAARNVLLTENLTVKITDFGMSRRLYNYQLYSQLDKTQTFLPWRWMSIEAIEDLKLSEKSDVWSFGVTLWEIFTVGELPYSDLNWISTFPRELRDGLQLSRPLLSNPEIYEVMQDCWKIEANQRPTFEQLKFKIQNEMQQTFVT